MKQEFEFITCKECNGSGIIKEFRCTCDECFIYINCSVCNGKGKMKLIRVNNLSKKN